MSRQVQSSREGKERSKVKKYGREQLEEVAKEYFRQDWTS